MNNLTKDEVMLQLANMASGIERTQGESRWATALREAIAMLDTAPKTDAERRYNIHGCGSANEVIKTLQRELDEYKLKYEGKNLVWFERDEVHGLDPEKMGIINLNEVKARGIESAVNSVGAVVYNPPDDPHCCAVTHNDTLAAILSEAKKIRDGE